MHERSAEQEARLRSSNHCRLSEGGRERKSGVAKGDKEVNVAFSDISR